MGESKKNLGCISIILIIIAVVAIVLILEHFTEQLGKLDWFSNAIIGVIILGFILLLIDKYLN